MDSVHSRLAELKLDLDRMEEELLAMFTNLDALHSRVKDMKGWKTEPLPVSKQPIVLEIKNRMQPIMEALVGVLRAQEIRIRRLEG